jgi:tetratricopeptide (TPR) repeat protein
MGLAAFRAGDFSAANGYFREVAKQFPLSEVYNNIGAAENELRQPAAIDDFRKALVGDQSDPTYLFNLSLALVNNSHFEEAVNELKLVLAQNPDDADARALMDRATSHEAAASGKGQERLKESFNETAFRQLRAVLVRAGD